MITEKADETRAARNGRATGASGGNERPETDMRADGDMVMRSVAGFGENLLTLTELQARLAKIELGQNLAAARSAVGSAVVGVITACSGLVIMLAGLAELLVSEAGMKRGYALLSVAASAIAAGAVCLVTAVMRLRANRRGFSVSSEELARNVSWLKTVLRRSGRSRG